MHFTLQQTPPLPPPSASLPKGAPPVCFPPLLITCGGSHLLLSSAAVAAVAAASVATHMELAGGAEAEDCGTKGRTQRGAALPGEGWKVGAQEEVGSATENSDEARI